MTSLTSLGDVLMNTWQLQHAKAHFSEVVRNATAEGPQNITLRGEAVAVVISKAEFDSLVKPKPSFVDFMRKSPLAGVKLNLKRNKSLPRDIDL
jgi:antitoxin Phd